MFRETTVSLQDLAPCSETTTTNSASAGSAIPPCGDENFPWKPIYGKHGITLPRVTWCAANFRHLTTLTFQCDLKCKTCLAKYDLRNLIHVKEYSYTMTCVWRVFLHHDLMWRKNGSKTRMTFSMHKQNILSKNSLFGGTVHKICIICMFCCADTILLRKWLTMDIGKSKRVWFGNNGCDVSLF